MHSRGARPPSRCAVGAESQLLILSHHLAPRHRHHPLSRLFRVGPELTAQIGPHGSFGHCFYRFVFVHVDMPMMAAAYSAVYNDGPAYGMERNISEVWLQKKWSSTCRVTRDHAANSSTASLCLAALVKVMIRHSAARDQPCEWPMPEKRTTVSAYVCGRSTVSIKRFLFGGSADPVLPITGLTPYPRHTLERTHIPARYKLRCPCASLMRKNDKNAVSIALYKTSTT